MGEHLMFNVYGINDILQLKLNATKLIIVHAYFFLCDFYSIPNQGKIKYI